MNYPTLKKYSFWMMVTLNFASEIFSNFIPLLHASCAETFLSSANDENSNTNFLIRYLGELYEIGALNIEDLKRFLEHLEQGEIINPIESEKTHSNPNATIQQTAIDDFLLEGNLRIKELFRWVSSKLDSEFQTKTVQDHVHTKTKSPYFPMIFYPVKIPKRIWGISLPHFIRQPSIIEVASTQLTEMQWYEVMGDVVNQNYIRHRHKSETIGLYVSDRNGKKVLIFPNHPVTAIPIWSVLVFANTLSIKHNLEPAYDLSMINFEKNTLASDGSLDSTNNLFWETPTFFNPKANGYRIPFRAERHYLVGIKQLPYNSYCFTSKRFEENCNNAWLRDNSDDKIHEVALQKPTLIDKYPFFDLIGNTGELEQISKVSRDKKNKSNQANCVFVDFFIFDGNFENSRNYLRLVLDYCDNPSNSISMLYPRSQKFGIRLVRTVKP